MKELNLQTKGTYFLCLFLPFSQLIEIGKLGKIYFKKGYYLYIGKAFGPGGLKARIKRHLKKNTTKRWHIDYLKEKSTIKFYGIMENKDFECKLAKSLYKNFSAIKGFGCSDCKCFSHLFYSKFYCKFLDNIKKAGFSARIYFYS